MSDRVLVDTNVLVYAYESPTLDKQARALRILDYLIVSKRGLLTTQVLSEFVVVVTRKITVPLTSAEAYRAVQNFLYAWQVADVTPACVLEAVRGMRDHQLHFWDALIWASARLAQVSVILSEDLPAASVLEGVRFLNPFAADFSEELL